MTLYFFDCDKTLYDYDFRVRLPRLAELCGSTQYHLASTWWVGGHEAAAEAGVYATSEEYIETFRQITGTRLTLGQWQEARRAAMTRIPGSIAALRQAADLGTVSLLSNNPMPFRDSLPLLAPDIAGILGENALVSADLGARKPSAAIFARALARYGCRPEDAMLIDDSPANVAAARAHGLSGFLFRRLPSGFDVRGLRRAIEGFAAR